MLANPLTTRVVYKAHKISTFVDTTKLDEPIQFVGTFERLLVCWQSTNEDVREAAFEEIQKRAIEYAHKALAGYNMRATMADEAVKLLIVKLVDKLAEE